jgi:hypothetical protein
VPSWHALAILASRSATGTPCSPVHFAMARRIPLCVVLVAALLSLCAAAVPRRAIMAAAPSPGGAGAPSPSAAAARCTASGPLEAGKRLNVSMDVGGRQRSFLLPKDFKAAPSPLMFALHGAGSTAAGFLDGGASCAHAIADASHADSSSCPQPNRACSAARRPAPSWT